MALRKLFGLGTRNNPFEAWSPAPKVWPILAGKVPERVPDTFIATQPNPDPYSPTLMIAFGDTGEKTLALLKEKVAQSNAGMRTNLRALLIREGSSALEQSKEWPIRVLELQKPSSTLVIPRAAAQSLRFGALILFNQVINYQKYQEWIRENLLDLGSNTQVFFIGSLAESIMGLLGETLQILRNLPDSMGKTNLFSRVVAFLALQSAASNSLPVEEIFAAYREVGRFLYSGPHLMNTSYGMDRVVRSALLDAFFVIENLPQHKAVSDPGDSVQLLAESLFTLVHPSSRTIWENLRNDWTVSGRIRHDSHQAVAHGIGIATLYIPIHPIKSYVGARLAYAAILGEQANVAEGLVRQKPVTSEQPAVTAYRFIANGAFTHESFEWILKANSAAYFNEVPDLDAGFTSVFQAQLSHNLVHTLNEKPTDIGHLCLSLEWLEKHLLQCEAWFQASKPANPTAPARFNFQYVLTQWRESVQVLLVDLRGWHQKFLGQASGSPKTVPSAFAGSGSRNMSNWRSGPEGESSGTPKDVPGILESYRRNAEKILQGGFNDPIYRSVVSDATGSLQELEGYYADTVRPELSRFTRVASTAYTRVRDRLEWWIRLMPDQLPQLYLVCWSPQAEVGSEPAPQYCFKSDHVQEFTDAVFALAVSQTTALESDLTRNWFHQRIKLSVDFLRWANDSFLAYDRNLASLFDNAAARHSYLIAHNPVIAREFSAHVFSDTPRFEVSELTDGESTRLTAISMRINVPFSALSTFQQMKRRYVEKLPEKIHLYVQEQTAALYEKRIWKLAHEQILLSPEAVSLLGEPELVTLFCQGLFTGVICSSYDENTHRQSWRVSALDNFAELDLAPASQDGLLIAFRRFVLELPNEPDLNQSPQRNFYPPRRQQYISGLTKQIKTNAMQPAARAIRESFREELEYWQRRGEQDELARSFSVILQCELDEPVWKDW